MAAPRWAGAAWARRARMPVLRTSLSPRHSSKGLDSVVDLIQPLSNPDPHVRQAACQSLAQAGLRCEPRVVAALLTRLQDKDVYVKQAAATSLGQVARRGDEVVLEALLARLGDPNAGVRRVAVNAVVQAAPRGSATAVAGLLPRLEDKDGGVRRSAVQALEKVSGKASTAVTAALLARTVDIEAFVRHAAVEVLGRFAPEGNAEVVERLLELLEVDRDARVRFATTEALGKLGIRGDSRVLTALLARLDDEADSVRRAAATALGHVTFAPLQELELQERHIAELEFRGAHEVGIRERTIAELKTQHSQEVSRLHSHIDELEERLRREIEEREERISYLESQVSEQGWLSRVSEFLPQAGRVTEFLDALPSMAGPSAYGAELMAPVWALRCVRGVGPCAGSGNLARGGAPTPPSGDDSPSGRDKRGMLSLMELFEQLSTGKVTPTELTDSRPLDVYVHQGDDGGWGLYCCSRHRLVALLMYQACNRSEIFTVKCIVRPKDEANYWGWQWSNFYDGGDGLNMQPVGSLSPTCSRLSLSNSRAALTPGGSTPLRFLFGARAAEALGTEQTSSPRGTLCNGSEDGYSTKSPCSGTTSRGGHHSLGARSRRSRSSRCLAFPGELLHSHSASSTVAAALAIARSAVSRRNATAAAIASAAAAPTSVAAAAPPPPVRTVPTVTMELVDHGTSR